MGHFRICPSLGPLPVRGLGLVDFEYLGHFRSLPLFCASSGGRSRPGGLRVRGVLPEFVPLLPLFRWEVSAWRDRVLGALPEFAPLLPLFRWVVSAWRTSSPWGTSGVCPSFAPLPVGGLGLADFGYVGHFRSLPLFSHSSGGRSRPGGLRVLGALSEFACLLPLFRWEVSALRTSSAWGTSKVCLSFALLPVGGLGLADFEYLGRFWSLPLF